MTGPRKCFGLEPHIVEAVDLARGKQSRRVFVRNAVLLKLKCAGYAVLPSMRGCAKCGEPFAPVRKDARYCSASCRARAAFIRQHHREAAE